jgi:hypothetical protein
MVSQLNINSGSIIIIIIIITTTTTTTDSLQKTAILGTSHIIRKMLQAESWKPEWWGSPLGQQEKYQGRKKTCDKK